MTQSLATENQFELFPTTGQVITDGMRDGDTFDPDRDFDRLNKQMRRVWNLMSDSKWRTLSEISAATGDPEASISARLRDFRKKKFGELKLNRRRFDGGLYAYQLINETRD